MRTTPHVQQSTPAQLDKKVAIITGASKGIGKATALALAGAGARLVLAARTSDDLEQVITLLRQNGTEAISVPTDITQKESVERLIQRTLETYQQVDILVNSAGGGRFGPVMDFAPEDWDSVLNVNLKGVYLCSKYVLPPMLAEGQGQIINILSIAAKVPFEMSSAYCAAKAGALAFTKVLSAEVRQNNIKVTAILPGSVHTSFWDDIPVHPDFEQMLKPEHVAQTVVSICCQPFGMVTEEIVVTPPLGIL